MEQPPRVQTVSEEWCNAGSHGTVALLALTLLLSGMLIPDQSVATTKVGLFVFVATLVLMLLLSTVYHMLPAGKAKERLNRLDHASIYLFIAGSFTPFAMNSAGIDGADRTLLMLVWLTAIVGGGLKISGRLSRPSTSMAAFVVVGWVTIGAALAVSGGHSSRTEALLLAGGGTYTLGIPFFMQDDRRRYAHCVWHLFVAVGSALHGWAAVTQLSFGQ